MNDGVELNPWYVEIQIPVRFTLAVSLDAVQRDYYERYGVLPDELQALDELTGNFDWDELSERCSMFEVVDDEFSADYDPLKQEWYNQPMRITSADGEVVWADTEFDDWRG